MKSKFSRFIYLTDQLQWFIFVILCIHNWNNLWSKKTGIAEVILFISNFCLILSEGWYGTVYCLIYPQISNSRMRTHLLHTSHFSSRILISSEKYFDISQRHSFLQKVWFDLISSKDNFIICVWERDEISQPLSYEPQRQQHLRYTFPMNLTSPLAVCDVGKV